MSAQYVQAGFEGEEETVSPPTGPHPLGAGGVLRRKLVVEREHDGLLAGEVAVEEPDAHAGFFRDITERRLGPATRGDETDRRRVEALPRLDPPGSGATRSAPTAWRRRVTSHPVTP